MESYLIIIMEYCHARLPEAHGFLSCHSDYSVKVDRLILFYRLLDKKFDGNLALMLHWFRKSHDHLKNSPFLAMVDHQEVEKVIELFNIDS